MIWEQKLSKIRFSDATVRALLPGVYYDTGLPAFGLRVGKNRRTWFVVQGADRLRTTLGVYPSVGLADARKRALGVKAQTTTAERSLPFPEARRLFLAAQEKNLRPRSLKEQARILDKHFTWTKTLDKITHNDIGNALDAIQMPSEANHAFKEIRTFFNWCVPRYLKHSPCTGLKMPNKADSRSRVLSDEELVRIWRVCGQRVVTGEMREPNRADASATASVTRGRPLPATFARIIQLLILTGQRRNEIASLKSDYIDLDDKTICLPATLTKNKREHLLPLGEIAASVLRLSKEMFDGHFLFPARGGSGTCFNGWSKGKVALDKLSGVTGWCLHDIRRTYATNMARLGVPLHVIEKLLNHVSGSISGVAAVYNRHTYEKEMRDAIDRYEQWIAALIK